MTKEDIEKQIEFLQKDVVSVKQRLEAVRGEEEQLVSTLASLQGAIQVSNHYFFQQQWTGSAIQKLGLGLSLGLGLGLGLGLSWG